MRVVPGTSLLALVAATAFGAAVSVNGTCQVGVCASPDVLASQTSSSTSFNFAVTLPNTDQYRIVGTINASGTSSEVSIVSPFTVVYMGNASGTASAADVVNLDVLQNFTLGFILRHSTESAEGGFGGALAAGSNVQIQLVIGGQALPVIGPFPSPASFSFKSQSYTLSPPANPVLFDVRHIFTFGAGSGVGATIYNALTPGSTLGDGSDSTAPTACDASSSGDSSCQAFVCETGAGGTLPIFRAGPKPQDSSTGDACNLVAFDGSGGTLPILYPSGPSGGDSGPPVVVFDGCSEVACDGSGGTLPILYPAGPAGGGGNGVTLIADSTGGSTLPIFRTPGVSAQASSGSNPGFPIEIVTPLRSIASSYSATASCPASTPNCWITIPVASGAIAAGSRTAITALINLQNLQPGVYTANVAITLSPTVGESPSILLTVPVTLALGPAGPHLVLSQTGLQFQAAAGVTSLRAQSISVLNAGTGTLDFTAAASTLSGNWLSVSPASGRATASSTGQVSIQANPAGLAPGNYSGLVEFSSTDAVNGNQLVEVTLTVPVANSDASISSSGLIFVTAAGSNPVSQSIEVSNPSNQTLTVNPSLSYASGSGWLTVTSAASTITSALPLEQTFNVNAAGLAPGVYLGSLDNHIVETNTDHLVQVLLVVKGPSCTPKQLLPVITNLEGGFQRSAGIPVPIAARVVDNCGTPLTSGAVLAYFPGGDASVSLNEIGPGQWSGTWLPHSIATAGPATAGIVATSFSPALYGSSGVLGKLAANPTVPLISPGGIVSAASLTAGAQAAGGLISIFGSNLATGLTAANAAPFPTAINKTSLLLGGVALPLQVVSPGQINAVVPYDGPTAAPQQMIVQQDGAYALPETVVVAAAQPAVFTLDQSGQGAGAIMVVKPNGTQFLNSPSAPASAGDALVIYCTGLGGVTPAIAAGTAAPSTLTQTVNPVTATVGGLPAQVFFAGLTPGFVGLYQVNAFVPSGVASGVNVPVVLSAAGAQSVPVTVAIQ